jgi:uncharacterized damage-inducible protein DinB
MNAGMDSLWLEAFLYNRWANLALLDACAKLTDEQLQLSAPGTYGTIAATLLHLISAENRYVAQLGGTKARISERDEFPGVNVLMELATSTGDELLAIADRIQPGDKFERLFGDHQSSVASGIVVLQALHHGNDHRTHICTILGQNGIEGPDIQVWSYGVAQGLIVPLEGSSPNG